MSLRPNSSHKGNFSTERNRISGAHFFCTLFRICGCHKSTSKNHALGDTFFRNHQPNGIPEMSLSYFQNMSVYYTSGKHILSILSFSLYNSFNQDISCSTERCLLHDTNVQKIFYTMNLTITFVELCNSATSLVSLSNEIFQLQYSFSFKYTINH